MWKILNLIVAAFSMVLGLYISIVEQNPVEACVWLLVAVINLQAANLRMGK